VIEGKLNVKYQDDSVELIMAGSIFCLPSGHTIWVDEDTTFIDFSPEKEYWDVVEHVTGKK
jgi:hypothetical protein